ncbi:non-canonical purine NTP pyrophosphatase [Halorientalis pallida]|uniref:Non-canonical purine NTP pyrophosphatase n=1 Tax=Halorientalis pallida TaxID=2479928 RepID=A0A498L5X0_9EURY|nr:non-canonical purine NTP pyrophosphatase [Halorientalis pallida]RXK50075.1 non-canonical purine NTP pyrophosphatase [Halorientalis pallida]
MLRFVTTNQGKVREAREYLGDDTVEQLDFDYTEIQADDLAAVAAHGAREAYRHTVVSETRRADGSAVDVGEPVLVDDAGLFVDAFDGFPGPYSSYVEDTVGVERVWRLTREEDDRTAAFRTVLAYCDGEGFDASPEPVEHERRGQDQGAEERAAATTDDQVAEGDLPVKIFEGYVPGEIVAPRGEGGFGYDPIFEHDGTTFAEMTPEEKNAVSHRGRALAKFGEWYRER